MSTFISAGGRLPRRGNSTLPCPERRCGGQMVRCDDPTSYQCLRCHIRYQVTPCGTCDLPAMRRGEVGDLICGAGHHTTPW